MDRRYNNHFYLLCTSCGRVVECDSKLDITVQGSPSVVFGDFSPAAFSYLARCDNCKHHMVQVDGGILGTVRDYNMAGIETEWSCEGHVTRDKMSGQVMIERPYIAFSPWVPKHSRRLAKAHGELCARTAYGIIMETQTAYDDGGGTVYHPYSFTMADLSDVDLMEHVRITFRADVDHTAPSVSEASVRLAAARYRFNEGLALMLDRIKRMKEEEE